MRDHSECRPAYERALAKGHDGRADLIQTRCEYHHGGLDAPMPEEDE